MRLFNDWRRVGDGFLLAIVMTIMALVFTSVPPAAAEDDEPIGSPEGRVSIISEGCNPDTGVYEVVWGVHGDPDYPDLTGSITEQLYVDITPTFKGQTVTGSQVLTGTSYHTEPGEITPTVGITWPGWYNGNQQGISNISTDYDGSCEAENPPSDADNDGVPDSEDAFPNNPNESVDTDSDGVGNNADECDNLSGPAANNGCPDDAPPMVTPNISITKVQLGCARRLLVSVKTNVEGPILVVRAFGTFVKRREVRAGTYTVQVGDRLRFGESRAFRMRLSPLDDAAPRDTTRRVSVKAPSRRACR